MTIFKLLTGGNKPWHIHRDDSDDKLLSLCGNSSNYNRKDYQEGKEFSAEKFTDKENLCVACVMKAYKLGKITVREK